MSTRMTDVYLHYGIQMEFLRNMDRMLFDILDDDILNTIHN